MQKSKFFIQNKKYVTLAKFPYSCDFVYLAKTTAV